MCPLPDSSDHFDRPDRVIGLSVARLEDAALVRGAGRFVNDIALPGQLHMRIVRSPIAHGRILAIDTSRARALPGVVAVWTHDDVTEIPPVDFRDPSASALLPYRQPLLARGAVRYVGEPMAAVFSTDPYSAEDAAELVTADFAPLPVLLSASGPPGEFAPDQSTEAQVLEHSFGDIRQAFADASLVVELDLDLGRHSAVPMETRGAIGVYEETTDVLRLLGAAKVPHRNRDTLCRMLGRSPAAMHLHESHVGGGFGVRGELYPEDVLVCVAAMRLRRPVKWIEDRREHLMAANHSRQQRHLARIGVDRDGRILGIEDEFFHDQGAYIRTHGARVMARTLWSIPGPYHVGAYRGVGHFRLTNKTPAATYRAPGGFESTFVRERLLDVAANKLGIDPVEFRRRNLVRPTEMPFRRSFQEPGLEPLVLDSGDYPGLLEKAMTAIEWPALQQEIARRRHEGEAVGLGVSIFFDESGRGPTDTAKVTVDRNGDVEVLTGGASVGQGFETAMAQVCADALGVDYRRIRVIHGQTDRIAFGIGAHASRATVLTGNAVNVAAGNLRDKIVLLASELLQTPADELEIVSGCVKKRGVRIGPSISLAELAARVPAGGATAANSTRPEEPGLSAEGRYDTDTIAFAYGVHAALVRLDRATGGICVERYVVAQEVGRAVNPMLVEGQIMGGCLQGLGGALSEEFVYSETGEPLAVTLADYLVPTARESPDVRIIIAEDAPSPFNPLGLKGAGEGGINGVGAAIAGAVDDALRHPGAMRRLPITPQRLMARLRSNTGEAASPSPKTAPKGARARAAS
jgi:carbon-monoxide dehydrogenase large subunit